MRPMDIHYCWEIRRVKGSRRLPFAKSVDRWLLVTLVLKTNPLFL